MDLVQDSMPLLNIQYLPEIISEKSLKNRNIFSKIFSDINILNVSNTLFVYLTEFVSFMFKTRLVANKCGILFLYSYNYIILIIMIILKNSCQLISLLNNVLIFVIVFNYATIVPRFLRGKKYHYVIRFHNVSLNFSGLHCGGNYSKVRKLFNNHSLCYIIRDLITIETIKRQLC